MNGQLNSLESFDSGSNYRFGDKMIHSNVARSLFDLSHLNTLTIPRAGMLVPITWFETLPGDDHDISVDCLLRVLPQVVPLYSRQRLYIYGFYSRYSDLWNNWQVFMDKGYTGTDNRTIPCLSSNHNLFYDTNNSQTKTVNPNDLYDYLGLPIGLDFTKAANANGVNTMAYISALPFMMYLRIYRDYFMNKNHWINDRVMLPDDDSRFRLDDNGELLSALDQNCTLGFLNTYYNSGLFDLKVSGTTYYFSGAMHDYPDDYFTSAIPWPQRGNAASITTSGTISGNLDFTNAVNNAAALTGDYFVAGNTYNKVLIGADSSLNETSTNTQNLLAALNKGTFSGSAIALNITLETLRNLAIDQQMMEQLARTDGSYFQFGLSFFGEPSKAAYDFKPFYIGGTYKNLAFTEVLQTATTQTTQTQGGQSITVDNPAGAYVGHGITGISNGRIGHIHCDDYGMIMLIACVMPDVYYHQGLDKTLTERTQEEKFLPDRALLGMQPILNKEIYYAGNNGSSLGDDNYLWAYQNPFDHLRYIPNKIHGKIADSTALSFFPYTQARQFTQLPNWGRAFSSTNDVRQDYLVAPSEDAYTAQFSMNIRSVRPLPYKATPAKLVHM